ncbi:hypothetical protein [Thermoplasma volcanium]|uniref:hypothetical protein n=1 Tax=Thermoplasma volcanium TaxID=50339 RepID=UPI0012EB041D|nr:hypothetical protein [Thermoplasma volcanium]
MCQFRPSEWETIRDAMDIDTKRICTSLIATGMRYAELQRFRENPDWLDGKFIYLHPSQDAAIEEAKKVKFF